MRIRFTRVALSAIRQKRMWWRANREKAPELFVRELAVAFARLRGGADGARQKAGMRDGRVVWRVLMPKTRNYVYYHRGIEVEVLHVWNAIAGSPPDLGET